MPADVRVGTVRSDGWLRGVRRIVSVHADDRPADATAELLVIHNISLPPGQYGGEHVRRLFTGTLQSGVHPFLDTLIGLRVSAHLFVSRNGRVTQFVPLHRRAWHAGASEFEGRSRCNDFSVGIEVEGTDFERYTDFQYRSLAVLSWRLRSALPLRAVRGHSHIAPGRKTDPGPCFDWSRFGREGGWAASSLPA